MREPRRGWNPGRDVAVGLLVLLGVAPAVGQTAREVEDVFWQSVVCGREVEVRAYLKAYPNGAYVNEARACLEQGLGLTREERVAVQRGLAEMGQEPGPADGLFGGLETKTRQAIRAWQAAKGMAATGYLTREQADILIATGQAAAERQRAAADRAAQEEAARQAAAADDAVYAVAEEADTAAAYGEYLEAYPAGRHAAAARERQAAREGAETFQVGRTFRDPLRSGGEGPAMVVVPAGSFQMGSPSYEGGRDDDEGPVHRVTIGEAFAVGVHEVTRAEYERFLEVTGYAAGNGCYTYTGGGRVGKTCGAELAGSGVSAKRRASGGVRELGGRGRVHGVVDARERVGISAVERSGVGIRGARGHGGRKVLGGAGGGAVSARERGGCKHGVRLEDRMQRWARADGAGGELYEEWLRVVGRIGERVGVGSGLLERRLCRGADGWHGVGTGKLCHPRCARRLLERQPGGPPVRAPLLVHCRKPGQRRRIPCCPEINPVNLYFLTFRGFQGGLAPLGPACSGKPK